MASGIKKKERLKLPQAFNREARTLGKPLHVQTVSHDFEKSRECQRKDCIIRVRQSGMDAEIKKERLKLPQALNREVTRTLGKPLQVQTISHDFEKSRECQRKDCVIRVRQCGMASGIKKERSTFRHASIVSRTSPKKPLSKFRLYHIILKSQESVSGKIA